MVQRVLVTAAASGIGKEIARAFAATSAKVCVCDIDTKALETAAKDIPGLLTKVCDVSKRQDIERMMVDAVADLGGLDVLVNNAGISGPTAPVESMDPDAWEMVMKVDLTGTFNVTRVAIPHLKKSPAGVIINMSSVAGRFGYANRSPYSTAKWGLIGFTKTLSIELGAYGIRANAILPGAVAGPRLERCIRGTRGGNPSTDRGYQEASDGGAVNKTAGRSEGHSHARRVPRLGCCEIDLGTDAADRQRHAVRVLNIARAVAISDTTTKLSRPPRQPEILTCLAKSPSLSEVSVKTRSTGNSPKALVKLGSSEFEFDFLDLGDLPVFNQDHDQNPPAQVARVKAQVAAAGALLFVTAEHNRSLPTALKNVLDWASRPYGSNLWAGKPAAIAGASPGAIGTAVAQADLRIVLGYLDVPTLGQPEMYIHFTPGLIDDEGTVTNDGTRKFLQGFMDRYVAWTRKFS